MISCVCGKKIIALQCFDVIFVLTKDMITFCWYVIKKLSRKLHLDPFYPQTSPQRFLVSSNENT